VPIAAAAIVLGAVTVTGFGPSLPGPNVRELLGLTEKRPTITECVPSAGRTRTPALPRPAHGSWRAEPPSPEARAELKAATLNGKIYLVGGQGPGGRSLATVVAFDPRTRRYEQVPDMPARIDHPLVTTHEGALYVVGGYVDSEPTGRAWRYAPGAGWKELPDLDAGRGGLAGGVIQDRLFAVAGAPRTFPEVRARPYASVEIYDLASGRWTTGPPIPTARHHTAASVLEGRLYVAGGRAPGEFSSSAFERYDPRSEKWEKLPALPMGSGGLELVTAGGSIVAIGGDDEDGLYEGRGWVTGAVWAFDPGRSDWRRLPDLRTPRHALAAAVAHGRIYAFEGSPCPGFGRISDAESLPALDAP
jgi:hypothetical protein